MKIYLHCPYEQKDAAKALGALYDHIKAKNEVDKSTCWYIPEEIDFHPFKKWIPTKTYNNLIAKETVKPFSELNHFLKFISINVNIEELQNTYKIIGDIVSLYDIPENDYVIIQITGSIKPTPTLGIKINRSNLKTNLEKDLRIQVTGTLELFAPYAQFQLSATDLIILDEPTLRLQQLKQWENLSKDWFKEEKDKLSLSSDDTKIGVISTGKKGDGFQDFYKCMSDGKFSNEYTIIPDYSTQSATKMAESIERFNNENYDCICIIRGGGSHYDLHEFHNPVLLQAIYNSQIPIILGIGHAQDKLLCDKVADIVCETPTAAAKYIKNIKYKQETKVEILHHQQKPSNLADKCKELEKRNIELEKKLSLAKVNICNLENKLLQIQQEHLIIEKNLKKGFFRRFFG